MVTSPRYLANRQRLHSSNDYLSPEAFEKQFLAA